MNAAAIGEGYAGNSDISWVGKLALAHTLVMKGVRDSANAFVSTDLAVKMEPCQIILEAVTLVVSLENIAHLHLCVYLTDRKWSSTHLSTLL